MTRTGNHQTCLFTDKSLSRISILTFSSRLTEITFLLVIRRYFFGDAVRVNSSSCNVDDSGLDGLCTYRCVFRRLRSIDAFRYSTAISRQSDVVSNPSISLLVESSLHSRWLLSHSRRRSRPMGRSFSLEHSSRSSFGVRRNGCLCCDRANLVGVVSVSSSKSFPRDLQLVSSIDGIHGVWPFDCDDLLHSLVESEASNRSSVDHVVLDSRELLDDVHLYEDSSTTETTSRGQSGPSASRRRRSVESGCRQWTIDCSETSSFSPEFPSELFFVDLSDRFDLQLESNKEFQRSLFSLLSQ